MTTSTIPTELTSLPKWIKWKNIDGKKIPLMKINEPETWTTFEKLKNEPRNENGGIGFVLDSTDDIGGIDLDACRNPKTGEITEWGKEIVELFSSYTEISPSKTGLKIWAKACPPIISQHVLKMSGESIGKHSPQIEAYSAGRYFAFTNDLLPGSTNEVRPAPHAWVKLVQLLQEKQINPAPSNGHRNTTLTSLAGAMRNKGMEFDTIYPALRAHNEQKFDPPLPEKEVQAIAKSICKYSPATQGGFALTDLGNGERFKDRHGNDLLYCYPRKSWLVWDGTRFKLDEDGEAIRRAKDTAVSILDEAKIFFTSGNDQKAKSITNHALNSQGESGLKSMLWSAQSELPVRIDELDQQNELLNLKNGTLDLKSLTLRPHNREDRLTKIAPVSLDGEAKCPLWEGFLNRVLDGDKELIAFVQRAIGYSLTGETSEHVLFLLHGTGANGKSTFIETILSLLGEYARPAEFRTFLTKESESVRNDLAGLAGIRFVSAVEVGENKQLDEAIVKQVTGGDTITARFLRQEFFDFKPRFKLWLAANSKPEIRGIDEGIWRRVLLVPFEVTIPKEERDRDLGAKLKAELPGILSWAVDGLRSWREIGLQPPEKVISATKEYREEQDLLGPFIEANFVIGENLFVSNEVMARIYDGWAGGEAVKPRTLGKLLKARGFKQEQKTQAGMTKRGWSGLGLNVESPF